MKTLIKNLVIIIAILAMIGCIKETTTYPMGDNKHTIKVRGQGALTTDEEMKTAWYEKAGIVCPSGYVVESIEEAWSGPILFLPKVVPWLAVRGQSWGRQGPSRLG